MAAYIDKIEEQYGVFFDSVGMLDYLNKKLFATIRNDIEYDCENDREFGFRGGYLVDLSMSEYLFNYLIEVYCMYCKMNNILDYTVCYESSSQRNLKRILFKFSELLHREDRIDEHLKMVSADKYYFSFSDNLDSRKT